MKTFTSPDGIFEINIPIDWDYQNELHGHENKSPFSFQSFKNPIGCFQISHYIKKQPTKQIFLSQNYFEQNLKFEKTKIDENDGYILILWGTWVKENFFMAKFIYRPLLVDEQLVLKEIDKAEQCLKSLICIEPQSRIQAIHFYRYEKFLSALAATFDLSQRALKNESPIELIILYASQIDSYLRLCIVLKYQIIETSNLFKIQYIYQDKTDKLINEKRIYKEALEMNIITTEIYDLLFNLYNDRNKIVHRYIISDIKTFMLFEIAEKYEMMAEAVRLILAEIEKEQFESQTGYYGSKDPLIDKTMEQADFLKSMVNEKHSMERLYRQLPEK